MTKEELKEQLKNHMVNMTVRLCKVIDAFPDDADWGWMEVLHALNFCIGCGYNKPIEKVIKNIKLSDKRNVWAPEPDRYTFQDEVKKGD